MILDIGCGPVNRADIRLDCVRSKATNILASAEYLPFRERVFDRVLSSACFEHLFNPSKALLDLNRVLKDDGEALVEVPKPQYTNQGYYHFWRFFGDLCITRSIWLRELKWLHLTLARAKYNKKHPLVHKRIITKQFLSSIMNVTKQESYAPMVLLSTEYYVSKLFHRPLKIAFLDCSVKYTLQKKHNGKVDVIIPLKGDNPHLQECLESCMKEIPVNRVLIGNGGCSQETLQMLSKYPNVVVQDHTQFRTQGYSIRKLVESVETKWFVYLHSDVVLPKGWFTEMCKHMDEYDWFECRRIGVHPNGSYEELTSQHKAARAYSGSQMGKTEVLKQVVSYIDDDFLFRTEDIVIQQILLNLGYKYGKATETYHLHYLKAHDPITFAERIRVISSIIKYCEPTQDNLRIIQANVQLAFKMKRNSS